MKKTLLSILSLLILVLGLNAQSYAPNHNASNVNIKAEDTSNVEKLLAHWKKAMKEVKNEMQASDTVFYMFTNYSSKQLDSMYYEVLQQATAGSLSPANINTYMGAKKKAIKNLYAGFQKVYNNYSNALFPPLAPKFLPSYTPPSCDTACTNMDFGTGDFTGWYGYFATDNSNTSISITGIDGGYLGAVQKGAFDPNSNTYQIHLTSSPNVDWFLNTYPHVTLSQASPYGNGYSAMIGDSTAVGAQVAILSQEFYVTPTTNSITYSYAVFLENPGHLYYNQPFFIVTLLDQNGDTIPGCGEYKVFAQPGNPGFKAVWNPLISDSSYYKPWSEVNVPLGAYQGQCVTLEFMVSDCSLGGHAGYAYVDASCAQLAITPASPSGIICGKNGSLTLDGPVGEAHYDWMGPNLNNADTLQNVNVDSVATYTLIVTPVTGAGCNDTLHYTVKGRDTIKLNMSIPTPIKCYGGTGDAMATEVNGLAAFTYQWLPAGGTNALATGLSAGTYSVSVTDSNGCEATGTVTLTQPPRVVVATSFTTATCGKSNGSVSCSVTGGLSPYTYLWSPGGNTTNSMTGLSAGTYTIEVTDLNGCTSSNYVTISQSFVTATMGRIVNVSCFGGNNGTATVNPTGGITPYTYAWTPSGGTSITGTGLTAGSYTVTVTDGSGCTATAKATITQPTQLTATISATNNVLCNGGTGSATATAGGGTSPYTYAWTPNGGTTANATGLTAGPYTVTVTDKNGCTATAKATITQPLVLTINITDTHASCNLPNGSATANITGGTSPFTYTWTPSAQTNATATGLGVGSYTVNVVDKNHCTSSATVSITQPSLMSASVNVINNVSCFNGNNGSASVTPTGGTSPYTYLWMPSAQTTAIAANLYALTYTVSVNDANGCSATLTVTLTQPTQLTATINEPTFICKDSTGILIAEVGGGTSPYTYSWSSGATTSIATVTPFATRDYSVTVTDNRGCTTTANIVLTYGPSLSLTVKGKASVCSGDSTLLCGFAAGGEGLYNYVWEPGNSTGACLIVAPTVTSIYTLSVIDQCGATTTVGTTVYTEPHPSIAISANLFEGCAPLCVQFRNNTTLSGGGGIRQYIWTLGNGDTLQEENPIYCYTSGGSYSIGLTAISDSGCSSTYSKQGMINVYKRPDVSFTFSPQPVTIVEPTVQFTDESSDSYGIIYHLWNFGDGGVDSSTSNLANPLHTYKDTGSYCVNLVDMNKHGCTDTANDCFIIEPAFSLYIPSAFTPNGDGIDDIFQPKGEYIKSFNMYIFDRWGLEVFHSANITNGWNGAVNGVGATCQEDTYIYKITVTDAMGIEHSYVGNVTLLK